MEDFKKKEFDLYASKYGAKKIGNVQEIWDSIKDNRKLLEWAITIKKDKFNERDLVNGLAICDSILIDYESIPEDIYKELISKIYSNTDIARLVLDGYYNGGYSFLLMSLWNPKLKLTELQKAFAVNEAMNKIGTTRYKENNDKYLSELEEKGITDDKTDFIDIDGSINPIGAKTKNEYMRNMFCSLSNTQAHGRGCYDIRYYILRNSNWSVEEKKKLIMDFWYDDETYSETLDLWQWGIVNDDINYKGNFFPLFDKDMMFDYTYEMLLELYGDKKEADRIFDEINFCKQMMELRSPQFEDEYLKTLK